VGYGLPEFFCFEKGQGTRLSALVIIVINKPHCTIKSISHCIIKPLTY